MIESNPLRQLCSLWNSKLELAEKYKKRVFGDVAEEGMRFYNGPNYDWMYEEGYAKNSRAFSVGAGDDGVFAAPSFRMTCLVADTPIRMADGSEKAIQDILVGDQVVTHTGLARAVLRIFSRQYTGELTTATLRSFPFPLTMTADHKMAIVSDDGISWSPASSFSVGDQMLVGWSREQKQQRLDCADLLGNKAICLDDAMAKGARAKDFGIAETSLARMRRSLRGKTYWQGRVKLPRSHDAGSIFRYVPVCPSFARLIGLYLAEGSLWPRGVAFTFGPNEGHYVDEVKALMLGLFGVSGRSYRGKTYKPHHNSVRRAHFSNKNLQAVFRSLCPGRAWEKRVPKLFFNADRESKIALLLGWLHGDGHASFKIGRGGKNVIAFFGVSVSEGLARDMTTLALSCGMRAKCTVLRNYRGQRARYSVHFSGPKAMALFPQVRSQAVAAGVAFKDESPGFHRFGCKRQIRSIERQHVSGVPVYDFEVEEDHSFLAGDIISSNCNKVAELVQIMGPVLYHKNPERVVRPRARWLPPPSLVVGAPPDPGMMQLNPMLGQQFQMAMQQYEQMAQQNQMGQDADGSRAQLIQAYLNYTPNECGLRESMRSCIDEALIKGRGVLWTQTWQPPGSKQKYVSSFYDTVDNLLVDPDMETLEDANWIAHACVHPIWKVEERYGLKRGTLRGTSESYARQTEVDMDVYPSGTWSRKTGASNDLVRYWEVYSRMGIGAKLSGAQKGLRDALDPMGDYVYLVIAKDVPFPLNLPPELIDKVAATGDENLANELLDRLDWPTPFWADNEWPMTELDFHPVPRCCWPMSHILPALGELKFLNWAYSFLAGKMRNTSRDFIAILKSAGEEIKQTILKGQDLALLEIESQHKTISEVVQFLQHPPMNQDIFKVIQAVENNFDKRTGLTEMMYGESPRQMRSAEEANIKGDMTKIRPDDMAEKVENLATRIARKEAIASRYHLTTDDVQPMMGPLAAQYWGQLVMSGDFQMIVREFDYRIEAGSTRKPNKDRDVENTGQAVQVFMPVLSQWAAHTGDVKPLNAFMADWAKARNLDAKAYMLSPPPPPPMPPQAGPGASPPKSNGVPRMPAMAGR